MDKVFLDTNVLLDYLAARSPFDIGAAKLFERAESGQIEILVSTLSICNISYILRKLSPSTNVTHLLFDFTRLCTLTNVDANVIADAIASDFSDFEDAVQHFSAVRHGGVHFILTRNVSDFGNSLIEVSSPDEYLALK